MDVDPEKQRQLARFIASVNMALPFPIVSDVMQAWIACPRELQGYLLELKNSPKETLTTEATSSSEPSNLVAIRPEPVRVSRSLPPNYVMSEGRVLYHPPTPPPQFTPEPIIRLDRLDFPSYPYSNDGFRDDGLQATGPFAYNYWADVLRWSHPERQKQDWDNVDGDWLYEYIKKECGLERCLNLQDKVAIERLMDRFAMRNIHDKLLFWKSVMKSNGEWCVPYIEFDRISRVNTVWKPLRWAGFNNQYKSLIFGEIFFEDWKKGKLRAL